MSFDLVSWLRSTALPLWGGIGVDAATGLFVERLDLAGRPLIDVPRRVMVQARQIVVFAEAERRGWYPGAALALRAAEAMVLTYRRDDGGWIFAAARDGRPVDETRDLYAHAFVLLALAHLKRLTGQDRWLALADATLHFLDQHLATPATGGYAEAVPAAVGPRRQNPHMHLFEALLALDAAAPGGPYRDRAEALLVLFERRFLLGSGPVVVEYHDAALRPLKGPPFAFEPGHHFEWAWLLAQNAVQRGLTRPPALAVKLCDVAFRLGSTGDGAFIDEVDEGGRMLAPSIRLWPLAEAIRVTACGLQSGGMASPELPRLVDALNRLFLKPAAQGCWVDRLDRHGKPLSTDVPASSLYHMAGAADAISDASARKHTDGGHC